MSRISNQPQEELVTKPYVAGLAVGFWQDRDELRRNCGMDRIFEPAMRAEVQARLYKNWQKAVERTPGWVEE